VGPAFCSANGVGAVVETPRERDGLYDAEFLSRGLVRVWCKMRAVENALKWESLQFRSALLTFNHSAQLVEQL
jgi:hypothetical protein